MRILSCVLFGLSLTALCVEPGSAQDQDRREFFVQLNGGVLNGLSRYDQNGVYDAKTNTGFAGTLGVKLVYRFAVRADVHYSSTPIRFRGTENGRELSRVFASLMAQIQFPFENGLNPYFLAGGGGGTLDQDSQVRPRQTVGFFVGGGGVAYRIRGTALSLHSEGRVYMYQPKGLPGNAMDQRRVTGDLFLSAGVSYAIPLR